MLTPHKILRDAALALSVAAALVAWITGPGFALHVLLAGGFAVLNALALVWLVNRVTRAIASGGSGLLPGLGIAAKGLVAVGGFVLLLGWLDPVAVLAGLAVVLLVLCGRALAASVADSTTQEA